MIYAIINSNVVESIVTNPAPDVFRNNQIVIDITDIYPVPEVGWTFTGNKLAGPVATPNWKITKLALRNRFTLAEMAGFYTAAANNVLFKILLDNLSVATFVDLTRPDTIQAMYALVSAGVLTSDRASAVLTVIPQAIELWEGK